MAEGMDHGGLEAALLAYDGKTVSILSAVRSAHGADPDILSKLVTLCGHPDRLVSDGATWILKAELEAGRGLDGRQTACLLAALPQLRGWQGRLHLCQIIPALTVTDAQRATLRDWLAPFLDHDRPLLRAWALDALCGVADGAEIAVLLDRMEQDPAASVRARVRALRRP
ncbi:MAG: hypothetical protein AAF366_20440 [Pseudomonadota bacterium]